MLQEWLEPVERLRGTRPVDPYSGQPGRVDWSSPTTVEYRGYIAARSVAEPSEVGRAATITGHTVYLRVEDNPGVQIDVVASDRLSYRGQLFEVDGEPFDWQRGVEVPTKQVEG